MSSDKSNPYLNANIFSRYFHQYVFVLFCFIRKIVSWFCDSWISPLLKQSRQKGVLHSNDLCEPPACLQSTKLTDKLESNWFDQVKHYPDNPSLIRATLKTLGWKPFLYGLIILLQVRRNWKLFPLSPHIVFSGYNTNYSTIITDVFDEIFRTMYFNVCIECLASCNRNYIYCCLFQSCQSSGWIYFSRLGFVFMQLWCVFFESISIRLIYLLHKWGLLIQV
jgi:hypothetical protein